MPETLIFLPGASGNVQFWKPASARLHHPGARRFMAWPGFGGVPAEPGVRGIDDLVARVVREIAGPVVLLAQSMGAPHLIRHLVLSVTSGGIDVASLGAEDWRPRFRESNPGLPPWFIDEREDLTGRLREIAVPRAPPVGRRRPDQSGGGRSGLELPVLPFGRVDTRRRGGGQWFSRSW